jgi:septation ring formation regulator EzrA
VSLISQEKGEHELKMKEVEEEYSPLRQKSKYNQKLFEKIQLSFVNHTLDVVNHIKTVIRFFSESLTNDLSCKDSAITDLSDTAKTTSEHCEELESDEESAHEGC